jgi:hypothetical protein
LSRYFNAFYYFLSVRQMHHWKKALARSMGWVDHVKFENLDAPPGGSQKTSPADRAFKQVQDSFVAKLHQNVATTGVKPADDHMTTPHAPLSSSVTHPSIASATREMSDAAAEALRRSQQQVVRSTPRNSLFLVGVAGAGVLLGAFFTHYYHLSQRGTKR